MDVSSPSEGNEPHSSSRSEGASGHSTQSLQAEAIDLAATQMSGLLPRDVVGVSADAYAMAACKGRIADISQPVHCTHSSARDCSTVPQPDNQPDKATDSPVEWVSPTVEPLHLDQALSRIRARTATDVGAPQVSCELEAFQWKLVFYG